MSSDRKDWKFVIQKDHSYVALPLISPDRISNGATMSYDIDLIKLEDIHIKLVDLTLYLLFFQLVKKLIIM